MTTINLVTLRLQMHCVKCVTGVQAAAGLQRVVGLN